jgi:hypothetical protein
MAKPSIFLFQRKNQNNVLMAGTKTEGIINKLKPEIVRVVTAKLSSVTGGTHDLAIAWKKMQDDAAYEIVNVLKKYLSKSSITSPVAKSTYPDIKISNQEGVFAIDIKVNEDTKDPWFDMARIDTMMGDRIEKYIEEWELVIKFRSSDGKFLKAFFNLFREVVGIRNECDGIKYRPYDGKVRPKSWADFDNNKIYWDTKEKFLEGIERSLKHRWKENIKAHLVPKLSAKEKKEFKKLFDEDSNNELNFS